MDTLMSKGQMPVQMDIRVSKLSILEFEKNEIKETN